MYGICFDFDSDGLKPESDVELGRIARTLSCNDDWILTIEGRADDVGASRPGASNDTLEGRAMNRRVERVRAASGTSS